MSSCSKISILVLFKVRVTYYRMGVKVQKCNILKKIKEKTLNKQATLKAHILYFLLFLGH